MEKYEIFAKKFVHSLKDFFFLIVFEMNVASDGGRLAGQTLR